MSARRFVDTFDRSARIVAGDNGWGLGIGRMAIVQPKLVKVVTDDLDSFKTYGGDGGVIAVSRTAGISPAGFWDNEVTVISPDATDAQGGYLYLANSDPLASATTRMGASLITLSFDAGGFLGISYVDAAGSTVTFAATGIAPERIIWTGPFPNQNVGVPYTFRLSVDSVTGVAAVYQDGKYLGGGTIPPDQVSRMRSLDAQGLNRNAGFGLVPQDTGGIKAEENFYVTGYAGWTLAETISGQAPTANTAFLGPPF